MTEKLQDLLKPESQSGVYRLGGRTGAKTLAQVVGAAGWQFLHLDGGSVKSKASFLKAAGEALHFPAWAGHNWDAFEELVNDLAWLPEAPGCVLLLDRLSHFAAAQPEQARLALEILQTAATNRQKSGDPPLIILIRGVGTAAVHLPSINP